jgi:hypothetical protein
MAVKTPDADFRRYLTGGSDLWDSEPASAILLDDYFVAELPPGSTGQIKAFISGSFIASLLNPSSYGTGLLGY